MLEGLKLPEIVYMLALYAQAGMLFYKNGLWLSELSHPIQMARHCPDLKRRTRLMPGSGQPFEQYSSLIV